MVVAKGSLTNLEGRTQQWLSFVVLSKLYVGETDGVSNRRFDLRLIAEGFADSFRSNVECIEDGRVASDPKARVGRSKGLLQDLVDCGGLRCLPLCSVPLPRNPCGLHRRHHGESQHQEK